MTSTTARKTISCSCGTCHTNANKVSATYPLAARVPAHWDTDSISKVHGLVTTAHHPILGKSPSITANITAVR